MKDGTKEQREEALCEPTVECETDRGLPRRYLSGSGPRARSEARAAPEHVHIWRSFQKPGAHWPARQGHVGPGPARPWPAPPPTAPPAPPPRARDPGRPGSCSRGSRRVACVRSALPCPGTAAQQGGPGLRPETAKPGEGRAPIRGESLGPRPCGSCAPHAPRGFPYKAPGVAGAPQPVPGWGRAGRIPGGPGSGHHIPVTWERGPQFCHYNHVRVATSLEEGSSRGWVSLDIDGGCGGSGRCVMLASWGTL